MILDADVPHDMKYDDLIDGVEAAVPDEPEENDSPGARERRSLRKEPELGTLAAKVRALGTVDDPRTMELLVDLLATKSELVREQIVVTMLKTQDAETQGNNCDVKDDIANDNEGTAGLFQTV